MTRRVRAALPAPTEHFYPGEDVVGALLIAIPATPAPLSLTERMAVQRGLVNMVIERYGVDPLDALVTVAALYGAHFPHPAS